MKFIEMRSFFIYGGVFQGIAIVTAVERAQWEVLGFMLCATAVGIWFAVKASRRG